MRSKVCSSQLRKEPERIIRHAPRESSDLNELLPRHGIVNIPLRHVQYTTVPCLDHHAIGSLSPRCAQKLTLILNLEVCNLVHYKLNINHSHKLPAGHVFARLTSQGPRVFWPDSSVLETVPCHFYSSSR
jgi:hypothetical protein